MRTFAFVFASSVFFSSAHPRGEKNPAQLDLMPWPAQLERHNGAFRLSESFAISLAENASPRLEKYARRAVQRLSGRTGLFFANGGLGTVDGSNGLSIEYGSSPEIALGIDEAYRLLVTPEAVRIEAATDVGAMRGLETLLQLLSADVQGYFFPAIDIKDAPRFPWRGLLIDVCRHFLPLEVIKRNLDGMAAVKLNVLHLHLTEDQGFRIECKTFPKLHELGSDGDYFTHEQIREIIAYAAARGIRVVPEFDMPGHVTSWLVGHPELASQPGPYGIERSYGVKAPSFDPTQESTYTFQEMTGLFPDQFVHIGGDENRGAHWNASASIQAFMRAKRIEDNMALQTYFNKRIVKILSTYGKIMVGWDEILQPGAPKSIVIQSWRGREALLQSAQQGYRGILSNGYYIDLLQPAHFHYLNDPLPVDSPLTAEQKKRILGGEATMWSEIVTQENVDSRIWPRTAAIAERFWSPAEITDVAGMYRRLERLRIQLEEHGLTHEKNYRMMLRRLAGGFDVAPLQTLVNVLEPVKRYNRHKQRAYTIFSPMTRVVDAARPDAPVARAFRQHVEAVLANPAEEPARARLESALQSWLELESPLRATIERSPVLQEILPHAESLVALAKIGLEALSKLVTGIPAEKEWLEHGKQLIEQAKTPHAETELMIVPAIEKLIDAVKDTSAK